MLRNVITVFFLLIFASQSLPIHEMGNASYNYDLTDELPESESSKTISEVKWLISCNGEFDSASSLNNSSAFYIHFADMLPLHCYGDVQTPPPDKIS